MKQLKPLWRHAGKISKADSQYEYNLSMKIKYWHYVLQL